MVSSTKLVFLFLTIASVAFLIVSSIIFIRTIYQWNDSMYDKNQWLHPLNNYVVAVQRSHTYEGYLVSYEVKSSELTIELKDINTQKTSTYQFPGLILKSDHSITNITNSTSSAESESISSDMIALSDFTNSIPKYLVPGEHILITTIEQRNGFRKLNYIENITTYSK